MTTLQTLSHTEVLQCDADTVWQAFQQASSILCNLIPEVFANCEYVKGHGEPGSIRILTLGPAMKAMSSTGGFVKERIDKLDHATRTLGYTVLEGGDPRYSHYEAEFRYACLGETTEATWMASFEPVGDMGPPYHLKATAPMVFKIFERVALAMKTFTHSEKLEGSPDSIWKAYKHSIQNPSKVMPEDTSMAMSEEDSTAVAAMVENTHNSMPEENSMAMSEEYSIALAAMVENPHKVMPEDNSLAMSVEESVAVAVVKGDECDKHGNNSVMKMVDPAIPHLEEVAEHMESVDDSARKLSYSLAKGDPRYMYFNATEEFTSGPEKGTTTATWVATYSPAGDLGAPEHIKNKVVSKWKVIEEAVKANPKLYV